MHLFPDKRKKEQPEKKDLFKVKGLSKRLKNEKRKDEIEKLKDVQSQDRTYYITLYSCIFSILLLVCLALFGGYNK